MADFALIASRLRDHQRLFETAATRPGLDDLNHELGRTGTLAARHILKAARGGHPWLGAPKPYPGHDEH